MKQAEHAPAASRPHLCHWPGCRRPVPPSLWGCKPHWQRLPPTIRSRILTAYRPGQEIDKRPSDAYLAAADKASVWALDAENADRALRGLPPLRDLAAETVVEATLPFG